MRHVCLGLNLLHDTSAALVVDGRLVAASEQERFDQIRHSTAFPSEAIDDCLSRGGVQRKDVTEVAVSFDYSRFLLNHQPFEEHTIRHDDTRLLGRADIVKENARKFFAVREELRRHGFDRVVQLRHHLAHAAGGYYSSGFPEANILIVDGRGERESTSLMVGSGARLDEIESYPIKDSLGHLYTYVTHLCGLYSSIGQEGKTMGLAAYGKQRFDFSRVLRLAEGRYSIDRRAMRALSRHRTRRGVLTDEARDLAYGVQKALEDAYRFLAEELHRRTGIRNFVLGGGVALNCSANGKLLDLPFVDSIFIQPAANDAGTSVGAALWLWSHCTGQRPETPAEPVYLGQSFEGHQVERALASSGVTYRRVDDPADEAAELIANGRVIGWFQGAMEFGPRALGNRSMLADPRRADLRDRVNEIKRREMWRPLAPSVAAEAVGDWFTPAVESPHMLLSLAVRKEKRSEVPAITHADGRARVQTVRRADNPRYHALLTAVARRTSVPMVLNTSLNTRGKPMARTPEDAIECFKDSGLDALVVGDFVTVR